MPHAPDRKQGSTVTYDGGQFHGAVFQHELADRARWQYQRAGSRDQRGACGNRRTEERRAEFDERAQVVRGSMFTLHPTTQCLVCHERLEIAFSELERVRQWGRTRSACGRKRA